MKIFSIVTLIPTIPLSIFIFIYTIMMAVAVFQENKKGNHQAAISYAKDFWGGVLITLISFGFSGLLLQNVFQ
jgi:uncharacterized membrane protein YjfL (UPF0719 family)